MPHRSAVDILQHIKEKHGTLNINSTDGIQRTLIFLEDALRAIAERIDGYKDVVEPEHEPESEPKVTPIQRGRRRKG